MIKERTNTGKGKANAAMLPAMHSVMVQNIITAVEEVIYKELNIHVKLQVADGRKAGITADVNHVMQQVANALCMTMADYNGGRKRNCTDLRCMACYLIKQLHPETSLVETAGALGIDHSSVIYHLNRAKLYLEIKEPQFVKKYETVINTLNYGNKN